MYCRYYLYIDKITTEDIQLALNELKFPQKKLSSLNNINSGLKKLNKKCNYVLKTITTLVEGNNVLKEKINVLENKVNLLENNKLSLHQSSEQDLIAELTDRQLRANNIIIFNLQGIYNNSDQIADADYDKISKIFAEMCVNIFKCTCSHLGKPNKRVWISHVL